MSVLEVVEASNGGVGRHVRDLSLALIGLGHKVTIAGSLHRADSSFKRFLSDQQDKIHFVSLALGRDISPMSDLRSTIQLLQLLRSEGPFDIVHGHSAKGGAVARMAGRLSGVPTVYTPHGLIITSAELSGLQASMYTWMERILGYLGTSKVIADSQDERRFIEESALIPAGRIAVIQNGMDEEHIEYFSTDMACEAISEQRPLTLGSTMRFEAEKAPNYLVEAFVELRAMLPHIPMQLVIAGDGKLFDVVERQARASGVGEKISFLGWRTNIKEVLRGLDIFVVPSLREAGLSYSTMEAMAAKLPIISTNVFGAKETLSRVSGNLLVPAGDPDALAHAMKRMATLTDSGLLRLRLREIGQANQAHIRAHFKQSETASRTLQLYQALSWP